MHHMSACRLELRVLPTKEFSWRNYPFVVTAVCDLASFKMLTIIFKLKLTGSANPRLPIV